MKNILFLTSDTSGCGFYRIFQPTIFLKQFYNIDISNPPKEIDLNFLRFDTFILQRPYQSFYHQTFIPWLKNRPYPKKVFIDMDDNLFELPDYNPAKKYCTDERLLNISKNLSVVDGIICSTEPLADYLKRFNPNTLVIPNGVSHNFKYRILNNSKLRVGWCGSKTHDGDFSTALIDALTELQNEIEIVIYGDIPNCLSHLNIERHPWTEVNEYYQTLYNLNLDVGLIPCRDNLFNRSKSNIKYIEYSICSTVSIADTVYPYSNSIIQNETGLFRNWYKHLKWLIDNKEERLKLSRHAYDYVNKNYTYDDEYLKLWSNII